MLALTCMTWHRSTLVSYRLCVCVLSVFIFLPFFLLVFSSARLSHGPLIFLLLRPLPCYHYHTGHGELRLNVELGLAYFGFDEQPTDRILIDIMDRCVNCGIATSRCNTLGRRALDDEMILAVIRKWPKEEAKGGGWPPPWRALLHKPCLLSKLKRRESR